MSYTFNQVTSACKVGSLSLKNVGCGCCAVASLGYNINPSKTLHEDVFKWMVSKGHTISQGSTRQGITAAIKNYGLKEVFYDNGTSLKTIMEKIKETGYGILLMHGTGASWCKGKNDYWTKGGHYISITDYNPDKGFYVRDSGARKRTGYHQLSDFEGDYVSGWAVTFPGAYNPVPNKKEDDKKAEYYPAYKGTSGVFVTALQEMGIDFVYGSRAKIALANGINDYKGTYDQNSTMFILLKAGKLVKA